MENEEKKEVKETKPDQKQSMHYTTALPIAILVVIIAGAAIMFGFAFKFHHLERGNKNFRSRVMVERNDRGPSRGGMMERSYNRAGTTGQVTKIDGNNLTVKDSSGVEHAVVVSDSTSYIKSGKIAAQADLQTSNVITVTGSSNSQGQITATAVQIW